MYKFDVEKVTNDCIKWIQTWFEHNGKNCNAVIGISGGKDSTVVAALCAKALGKDRVIGVLMPQDIQSDIDDSYAVVKLLGIKYLEVNIGKTVTALMTDIAKAINWNNTNMNGFKFTPQMIQNLPPRIRMSTLYAVSQCNNGRVIGTCNLSEIMIGWFTKAGDGISDVEPIAGLTASEVIEIGKYLGLPTELVCKVPSDGLCGKSDEDKFGFTYSELDDFLRNGTECKNIDKITNMIINSDFKRNPTDVFTPHI